MATDILRVPVVSPAPAFTGRQISGYVAFSGLLVVLAILFLQTYSLFQVSGDSMEPAIADGATVLLRQTDKLEGDQIAIFPMPAPWEFFNQQEAGQNLVKRVWAGPGDEFAYDGEVFTVNGKPVGTRPPYPCFIMRFSVVLGPKQVFMAGDNVGVSLDSRRVLCSGGSPYVDLDSITSHGSVAWQS